MAGVGGEEAYTAKFTKQALALYSVLTGRLGFDGKKITVLTEQGVIGPENAPDMTQLALPPVMGRSDAAGVRHGFDRLKEASADSLVLIVLIGHGSFDGRAPKFNIVGPDLSAKDYAQMLGALPSRRIVFVDCSSSSGEFIKPLSAPGRIIITATRSGNEQNLTEFADSFIQALSDPAADSDKDGRLSILEVFQAASKAVAKYYEGQGLLATEHSLIDDNGDGKGHESATEGDGALAASTYLDTREEPVYGDAETAKLQAHRRQLEDAISLLKARKSEMKEAEYGAELERLLVELAKVNEQIKARSKISPSGTGQSR